GAALLPFPSLATSCARRDPGARMRLRARQVMVGAQCLGHTPRLRKAAARRMWNVPIVNLTHSPDTRLIQVRSWTRKQGACVVDAAGHAGVRQREGSEQPTPDGALGVRGVASGRTAAVATHVSGIAHSEAP